VGVIEKGFELVPFSVVSPEYFSIEMLTTMYQADAKDKAMALANESYKSYIDELAYLFSLPKQFQRSGDVDDQVQRNLFFLQKLQRSSQSFGEEELTKKIDSSMQEYYKKYSGQ
jgi:hypothetical protein